MSQDATERSELAFVAGFLKDSAGDQPPESANPPVRGATAIESQGFPEQAVAEQEVHSLISSLPTQYALSTSRADQEMHARLLRTLRLEGHHVLMKWVRSKNSKGEVALQLHIVFRDRCACPLIRRPVVRTTVARGPGSQASGIVGAICPVWSNTAGTAFLGTVWNALGRLPYACSKLAMLLALF